PRSSAGDAPHGRSGFGSLAPNGWEEIINDRSGTLPVGILTLEGSMSFHVVRHEPPTILVMTRQTYETYRFTIGDDVALAHVGPPSDLAKARRTAIAFLAQRDRENPPC